MVETAIYVLLGALTTALLALLALPAVSRRAYRLAQDRARLLSPLSAAEALAERDALRGRHAIEITLTERRAETAEDKWTAAQMKLGERAAEIVRRDADISETAQEIARQREEIAALAREQTARDTEIAAREMALRDFERQRDAAEGRFVETTAQLRQTEAEAARAAQRLEARIEDVSRELSLTRHRADSALFAAKAAIADLERRLEESGADALRLRRQIADATDSLAAPTGNVGGDAVAATGSRENELGVRVAALVATLTEAQAAARAARADRDAAEQDAELWRERAEAEARAARAPSDDLLRQTIARLGRELVAMKAPVDSQREPAS